MRKTALKRKTKLKPVSDKQSEKRMEWFDVTAQRLRYLASEYGQILCEFCQERVYIYDNEHPRYFHPHHIDRNRANNTVENCYICHAACHQYIHDHNLKVSQEDWCGKVHGIGVFKSEPMWSKE